MYLPPCGVEPVAGQASAQPPPSEESCLGHCNASPGQILSSSSEDTGCRPLDERRFSGFDIDRVIQEIAEEEPNRRGKEESRKVPKIM